VRSERFYYDGIRRLQELVTDPVLNLGAAGESGDPALEALGPTEWWRRERRRGKRKPRPRGRTDVS